MKWPFTNPSEFADRSGDSLPLRAPREWSNADRSSGDAILKRSILFLRRRAATSNPVLRMADGPRGPGNPGDAGIKGCGLHINLATTRSEEHTSELQSLTNLVCRLLLAKKKIAARM